MICAVLRCRIWNNVYFVGVYIFYLHKHTVPIKITIQQNSPYITPNTENNERRSTIGGQTIVERDNLNQT